MPAQLHVPPINYIVSTDICLVFLLPNGILAGGWDPSRGLGCGGAETLHETIEIEASSNNFYY